MWSTIRKASLLGVGVGVWFLTSAAGGSPTVISSAPVPSDVQQGVHDKYGSLGFIPTQVPNGYGFRNWGGGATSFGFTFGPDQTQEIQFGVDEVSCQSAGAAMQTFETNGVTVDWSATEEDQQAWRCVTVGGTDVLLIASRSVPGDVTLDTPAELQDAQQLVDLVAYAQVPQRGG